MRLSKRLTVFSAMNKIESKTRLCVDAPFFSVLGVFVFYTFYKILGGLGKPYKELAGFCFVGISVFLSYFFRVKSKYFRVLYFMATEIAVPNGKYNNFVWGPLWILFGLLVFLSKTP